MSLGIGENILKLLQEYNPWWRSGTIPHYYNKQNKRSVFKKAYSLLTSSTLNRHVLLTGPRHAGKTTIVHQLINSLLSNGIKPEQIFYISLDHPLLKLCTIDTLLFMFEGLQIQNPNSYILIDEVQFAEGWDNILNQLYYSKPSWHIFCCSSTVPDSFSELSSKGEIIWSIIKIPTLTFFEFCSFSGNELPNLSFDSIHSLPEMDEPTFKDLCTKLSPLYKTFSNYILTGGFPELVNANDSIHAQRLLSEDIIEKSLKCDIPALYKIRHPELLDKVFLYLCYQSGQIINMASMSRAIDNTPVVTLLNYINYLYKANLINICEPVTFDGSIIQKPKSKIYVSDPSIRNATLMLTKNDILVNVNEQKLSVQTLLSNHLSTYYQRTVSRVAYHKKISEKGIDFIAESTSGRILIDLRYCDDTHLSGRDTLNFIANNANIQVSLALLLTKHPNDFGIHKSYNKKTVHRIPVHVFLYLLGLE